MGRERFPRAKGSSPSLPGGFGTAPGRHYDRSARQLAGLGQAGAGNARFLSRVPGSAQLKLSSGVRSPLQVPWWDADRRARCVQRATASRKDADGRIRVCRRPAFLLLLVLLAGPDRNGTGNHHRRRSAGSSSDFFARRAGKTRARLRRGNADGCAIVRSESENQ
jgi:hypothetical protein